MSHFRMLLCFMFLLPACSFAQSYFPGYAVKNNGDTLKGYINYKRWEYNPKVIEFKPEADMQARKLSFNDISYFSIDIGYPLDFKKYAGTISMDDINVNNVTTLRDTSYKIDTVFLKILRKGKNITLFSYDDALKTRFFVADGQSDPVELVYRLYLKNDEHDGNNTINEETYKKQLVALAEKYDKMSDALRVDINHANYAEMYLVPITNKINGYTGKDVTKGNNLGTPPKTKLVLMSAIFLVVAYLMVSVMHK
jgi:hypothetical protein